jgi:hypothetical protein
MAGSIAAGGPGRGRLDPFAAHRRTDRRGRGAGEVRELHRLAQALQAPRRPQERPRQGQGQDRAGTTFKRSTKIYKAAIKANKWLYRDKDAIACEKR